MTSREGGLSLVSDQAGSGAMRRFLAKTHGHPVSEPHDSKSSLVSSTRSYETLKRLPKAPSTAHDKLECCQGQCNCLGRRYSLPPMESAECDLQPNTGKAG